jgi:hypothetical protein
MSVIVNRATHFRPAGRRYLMVAGVAALSLLAFVGLAIAGGGPGFPLDDAWIHQTYARNLARSGQWEYVPGVVSAGSTAPLWTMLLALGYLLRLPYLWWAYFLGFLSLLWLAHAATALWRQLWPEQAEADWLVALVLVLAWPLVCGAAKELVGVGFTGRLVDIGPAGWPDSAAVAGPGALVASSERATAGAASLFSTGGRVAFIALLSL